MSDIPPAAVSAAFHQYLQSPKKRRTLQGGKRCPAMTICDFSGV
jgi:hypothetical protein